MVTKKQKEVRTKLKNAQDLFLTTLQESVEQFKEGDTTPEEEKEVKRAEYKTKIALTKASISALKEELKTTKLNPNDSSFFEWHPHRGMNRQQAKRFQKLKREGRIKPKNKE